MTTNDLFHSVDTLTVDDTPYVMYRLDALEKADLIDLKRTPFSIRVMLESALRQCNENEVTQQDVRNIAAWKPQGERPGIPFLPARVLMHDLTGLPAVVDMAAMRSAVARLGGDPRKINPLLQTDLVIDHSLQVEYFGIPDAVQLNTEVEFQRNRERYEFLKWAQNTFSNFRVVPPTTGILHQINLEYLANVVSTKIMDGETLIFPDTLVGTDSHTPMINGMGVLGWGVGGIEAEAVMLGQPVDMLLPDVIGFKLFGKLSEGVSATDLVLTIVQMLRQKGVVEKFVEFFGPGLEHMSVPDRATIANMAPEYGATIGYFPVDEQTLRYMRLTGRSREEIRRTEAYLRVQGLFRESNTPDPEFTDILELDLGSVLPSLAGPKRPQDRVPLSKMKDTFQAALRTPVKDRGYELSPEHLNVEGAYDSTHNMRHGAVVIAAITSCTNTSNPSVLMAAGLLAQKAVEKGLQVKPYVKTSLAPGSRVVTEYLQASGLMEPLAKLGFDIVGYGCTTCIGASGPIPEGVGKVITDHDLVATAVLSGNRNFEGRIHALVRANYLASPPLVVAYAIAGTVDIDLMNEPLGVGLTGPVYLKDIWPSNAEVADVVTKHVWPEMFTSKYASVFEGSDMWKNTHVPNGELFAWDDNSSYIHHPPYFKQLSLEVPPIQNISGARVLGVFRDSITTDHISPVGSIAPNSPAGKFLQDRGVAVRDFNTYGTRRGNDLVMVRGTFGNIRLKNVMVEPKEGFFTMHQPSGDEMTIYEAAMRYQSEGVPAIVLAGKEYGNGSSRDWAAKGPLLLGVKAVMAESFERIHRSNLVGMGVLPLRFVDGQSVQSLGLHGTEVFDFEGLNTDLSPRSLINVKAIKPDGSVTEFQVMVLLNTPVEVNYYRNGGILHTMLRKMVD